MASKKYLEPLRRSNSDLDKVELSIQSEVNQHLSRDELITNTNLTNASSHSIKASPVLKIMTNLINKEWYNCQS